MPPGSPDPPPVEAYDWLIPDSAVARAWQAEENAQTDAYLAALPHLASVAGLVRHWTGGATPSLPRRHGGREFTVELGADGTVSVDGRTVFVARDLTLDYAFPSPDGYLVAVGLSRGGDEQATLRLLDVTAGRLTGAAIPFTSGAVVAWLPDSSGFLTAAGRARDEEDRTKVLMHHTVGGPTRPEDVTVDSVYPTPTVSDDGRFAALHGYPGGGSFRLSHVRDLCGPGGWWRVVPCGEEPVHGVVVGDRYLAMTREGAPRGRLVAIPLDPGGSAADIERWVELRAESDDILETLERQGDVLVLRLLRDMVSVIEILSLEGETLRQVPMPFAGHVADLTTDPVGITFTLSSHLISPGVYGYDLASRRTQEVVSPARRLEEAVERRIFVRSSDGVDVPVTLVHHADLDTTRPQPTLLHAYGGFNKRFVPMWDTRCAVTVAAGGVYARAHARGGGEFGGRWWQQGRMRQKQQSFDDIYAVAADLARSGVTTRAQLGFVGHSNGGLAAGVILAQRPELFGAVVAGVPILDLVRAERDPLPGKAVTMEYGDVHDAEQRTWLEGYSPVQGLSVGMDHPAFLVVCGADDVRCPAWHSRVFLARLRDAARGDRPMLLRAWDGVGHLTGMTATTREALMVEELAMLFAEIGLEPPELP